uniref:Uncharacterized protein n=1 Tax=Arundo donax TaxID=35708 RepID=A0A0A8Y6A2_ARUDO
MMKTIPAIV